MPVGVRRDWAILMLSPLLVAAAELPRGLDPQAVPDPFPSTYVPAPSGPLAIVGATLLTGTGAEIADATLLLRDGKVEAVGQGLAVPAGYAVIDARGKWVTPGVIDAHSHLGASGSPSIPAHDDTNEATAPNAAEAWIEHSVWPQDPKFRLARAAGVTTLQLLPGSANLFGGRSVTVRNVPATSVQGMKLPGAPHGLKMACGENPKATFGGRGRAPATRMGNVAGYRAAWIAAADYARRWDAWRAKGVGEPPRRDLQLDTLAGVLKGEIRVQNHCYRADEMTVMIDVAREFGFRIAAFHHASEAYKIAPLLTREDICIATWAEAWGAKMESFDGIEENAAMIEAAGGCAVLHSDDGLLGQRLNQEAGIAMAAGRASGLAVDRGTAIKWITLNPARAIGIERLTGSLEPGKAGDVVLWSADPLSVYALAERVWIDGALVWNRADPAMQARQRSDMMLGQPGREVTR
jgi:imidazolonepropionase-like amidohydrolase